jgi:hypothetical protein
MIAADIGKTFKLGRYVVRIALRHDNPAFAKYLIFRGDKLIGRQFSWPCESDCQWHERMAGVYATVSQTYHKFTMPRRGRPTNAERDRRAALTVEDLAA